MVVSGHGCVVLGQLGEEIHYTTISYGGSSHHHRLFSELLTLGRARLRASVSCMHASAGVVEILARMNMKDFLWFDKTFSRRADAARSHCQAMQPCPPAADHMSMALPPHDVVFAIEYHVHQTRNLSLAGELMRRPTRHHCVAAGSQLCGGFALHFRHDHAPNHDELLLGRMEMPRDQATWRRFQDEG